MMAVGSLVSPAFAADWAVARPAVVTSSARQAASMPASTRYGFSLDSDRDILIGQFLRRGKQLDSEAL
jgi:hypothetical protein